MHTFAELREVALRVERLVEEEMSMVPEETGFSKGGKKRKGGFSTTFSSAKVKSISSRGNFQSKGGGARQGSSV